MTPIEPVNKNVKEISCLPYSGRYGGCVKRLTKKPQKVAVADGVSVIPPMRQGKSYSTVTEFLELVKAQYGILTHCDPGSEAPWLAVAADRGETRDIATLMAEECRYLEYTGRTHEADTEAEAVLGLIQRTYPMVTCLGDVPVKGGGK